MLSYAVTLSDALTPITLISGVGLLLLAMTARYNYTTDRVRALLKERRQKAHLRAQPLIEECNSGSDDFCCLLRYSRFGDDP